MTEDDIRKKLLQTFFEEDPRLAENYRKQALEFYSTALKVRNEVDQYSQDGFKHSIEYGWELSIIKRFYNEYQNPDEYSGLLSDDYYKEKLSDAQNLSAKEFIIKDYLDHYSMLNEAVNEAKELMEQRAAEAHKRFHKSKNLDRYESAINNLEDLRQELKQYENNPVSVMQELQEGYREGTNLYYANLAQIGSAELILKTEWMAPYLNRINRPVSEQVEKIIGSHDPKIVYEAAKELIEKPTASVQRFKREFEEMCKPRLNKVNKSLHNRFPFVDYIIPAICVVGLGVAGYFGFNALFSPKELVNRVMVSFEGANLGMMVGLIIGFLPVRSISKKILVWPKFRKLATNVGLRGPNKKYDGPRTYLDSLASDCFDDFAKAIETKENAVKSKDEGSSK